MKLDKSIEMKCEFYLVDWKSFIGLHVISTYQNWKINLLHAFNFHSLIDNLSWKSGLISSIITYKNYIENFNSVCVLECELYCPVCDLHGMGSQFSMCKASFETINHKRCLRMI